MWFLLLIFAFTSADLVDTDDNIAMESQATQYRAKHYRPEAYQQTEQQYSQDYETNEYYHKAAASARRPKKYHESKNEKENVYLNKNNYASRAREPRDEAPWRPLVYQNEEETRPNTGNYHYQESTVKPQKNYYYYSTESSKVPKKYQESTSEQQNYVPRYKPTPQPTASTHYERPQETHQTDSNNPNQHLQTPFAYLQRYEENAHGGKMLGYTSLVEHFADHEMNDEEMKMALKEGTLEDIKKIVPKSGAVFEIYSGEETENAQYASKNQAINNNVDQNDVSSSATTYSYAKPVHWGNHKNSNQPSVSAPTKSHPQIEKKKPVKATRTRTREHTQQYPNDQNEESNARITVHSQKPRPAIKTTQYPQNQPYTKSSYNYSLSHNPIIQETRNYPQIEAASKQTYRPIQSVLSDQNDYYRQQQNDDYRIPQKSALQSQAEPTNEENANNYYTSNIRGYSNYSNHLPSHSSEGTSETEINRPGSNLRTVVVYSSTPKPLESPKHYYEHYKHPNHIIQNNKPESFDHQKALQGSFSFNSGNILGNHKQNKQEPSNHEASLSPIQFSNDSENSQKQKASQPGPKHIQKYVEKYAESLFKSMYKTKEEQNDESKPYRYQLELIPRPAALVGLKQPPKFDAETPIMTEEEFQSKFGHLPVIVSTPRSPYSATTVSSPTEDIFDIKLMRPHAEALTQYWSQQEKEKAKHNKYPTKSDVNQGNFKKPQASFSYHPSIKYPYANKYNDISEESTNTVSKYAKGQIERPSLSGWKNGKIYLTKEFDGKFSDLYIKNSDKENLQHSASTSHIRPGRLQGGHKNIILGSNFAPHVQETSPVRYLKYDINLSPSFRLQKRGDEETKNVSIVSENDSKSSNYEKKKFKKQGVVLTSSNNNSDRDSNQFSVSASYQINRSDNGGEENK